MAKKSILLIFLLLAGFLTLQAAWTQKRLTTNAGDSNSPDLAVDGSNVYVIWSDNTWGNHEICFEKSADGGTTWNSAEMLSNNSEDAYDPAIAVSSSNVYAVWIDNYNLYFRKSANGGTTWQTVKKINDEAGAVCTSIAVSGANIYLAWGDGHGTYFKKSADGGSKWQTVQIQYYEGTEECGGVKIAACGANIYMVWWMWDYNMIFQISCINFAKSSNGGTTWTIEYPVGSRSYGAVSMPSIVVNGSNVFVFYVNYNLGHDMIYFKKSADDGASWTTAKRLTSNLGNSIEPSITVNNLKIYVVYSYYITPRNTEIYFKKSANRGTSWPTTKRLTNYKGYSLAPKIAVSKSKIFVVWYDNTSGNNDIYLKYSPLI